MFHDQHDEAFRLHAPPHLQRLGLVHLRVVAVPVENQLDLRQPLPKVLLRRHVPAKEGRQRLLRRRHQLLWRLFPLRDGAQEGRHRLDHRALLVPSTKFFFLSLKTGSAIGLG